MPSQRRRGEVGERKQKKRETESRRQGKHNKMSGKNHRNLLQEQVSQIE
jgi:hypothetical protein